MHGNLKEEYFFNFVFQPYLEADQISGITIIGNEVTEQVIKQRDSRSKNSFKQLLPQGGILWTNNAKGEMEGEQLAGFHSQDKLIPRLRLDKCSTPDDTQPPLKHGMRQ
jgi:hypothetical protein